MSAGRRFQIAVIQNQRLGAGNQRDTTQTQTYWVAQSFQSPHGPVTEVLEKDKQ